MAMQRIFMVSNELYLTEAQFAERYHIGRRTVQRWRQSGEGPAWVRLGQRRVLYRLSDCEAWAATRTFRHRADELSRLSAA
jgi:predicted DNA-binding transcriptional regulator AlpA